MTPLTHLKEHSPFVAALRREIRLMAYRRTTWLQLGFFIGIGAALPKIVLRSPELTFGTVATLGWVATILSALLTLDHFFSEDIKDGTWDLVQLSSLDGSQWIACKCVAHWLFAGLPLVPAMGVVALVLDQPPDAASLLALSILMGSPALSCLACLVSAATIEAHTRTGIASALLVLLCIPPALFGIASASGDSTVLDTSRLLALSFSLLCVLAVPPLASAMVSQRDR